MLLFVSVLTYASVDARRHTAHPRQMVILFVSMAVFITTAGVLLVPSQPTIGYMVPIAAGPLISAELRPW